MAKKKPDFIPMVDVVKSGVNMDDIYKDKRDEDGRIRISRSKNGMKIKEESIVSDYLEQEKKLEKLKKEMEGLKLDKDDVKDIKKDIKKKNKKDKDKKKPKKSKDSYMNALVGAVPDDLAAYIEGGGEKGLKKKKKKDKKKKKERDSLAGLSFKEKKKRAEPKKDKEKEDKSKSEVMQRFKEVERITKENIKEIDDTLGMVDVRIKDIMKSSERMRGKDNALAQYLNTKASLISIRQKAATDVMSNRAKVYDIEMKKEKEGKGSSASDADIIARIFPGIAMGGSMDAATKSYISDNGKNKNGKKKNKKKKLKSGGGFEYDDDDELLSKKEKELLKSGDIEYSDYDANIEWEGQFDVAIKKSFQTGDWKFMAIDDDGNVIRGVPKSMLPSKKSVQMKFDDEKDVAIDMNSNRAFRVFQVPQI